MIAKILESDLSEGNGRFALVANGWPVLICRSGDKMHAVINRCTHQASALDAGRVRQGIIMCPLHGARFDLASGRCLGGGYAALRIFPVAISGSFLEIEVPDEPPSSDFALPRN